MQGKKLLRWLWPVSVLIIIISLSSSCKKDKFLTTGGQLAFSVDTLLFDTVFTQQGSATHSLKIFNKQKEKVNIDIRLKLGDKSAYRLNVNGTPGTEIKDVEIAGNDSVWVFAAVTIDPTNEDNPFVEEDQLIATLNGQDFSIPVIAYGQNAHYIVDSVLETQTWLTDKPYVIIHNALVDEGQTLTIPAGVRVYMHQDSRLYVSGSLQINGTKADSVIFQGDRLDPLVWIGDYIDIPGQWGGLYFTTTSHDNVINYAVFKNGGASTLSPGSNPQPVLAATIQADSSLVPSATPKLKMTNTVIHTSQGYGLLTFNSTVDMQNCRITECGAENVMLFQGGIYHIYNCTIGTYGSQYLSHTDNISMAVLNYYPTSQTTYISGNLNADIKNCIVYGSLNNEVLFDQKAGGTAAITLWNNLLRSSDPLPGFVSKQNNLLNQDPLFVDLSKNDYHLQESSPAKHAGVAIPGITADIDGTPRANPPSIGCYE